MPTIQHDPSDQVATIVGACPGSCGVLTDDALGLATLQAKNVKLHVTCDTSADCFSEVAETSSSRGEIYYSTDGGSGWTEIVAKRSSVSCGIGGASNSDVETTTTEVVALGDFLDISQIRVRAEVSTSASGSSDSDATSDITDWWITGEYFLIIGE